MECLAQLLAAHRRRIGTPKNSRALGPFRQAVLVLRWIRERGCVHCLARDADVFEATGYRYLHEDIDVLADQAPDLHEVLNRCQREGMTHVILDGTLIESDRLAGVRKNGNDLWFSQKHKAFGGNIQFLSAPDSTPLWVFEVEPGSTPAIGAGIGIPIPIPVRHPKGKSERALHVDTRMFNTLLRHVRALGERAAAELKQRWRTLQHVTLRPSRIGDIARAALVLNGIWK
ncbi:transposase [Kitasatospora sp. Root187]|nr:transposase [Kitasatospora sp. Root107]KRB68246.1 transposase [Kitasatospora sp. Root187]